MSGNADGPDEGSCPGIWKFETCEGSKINNYNTLKL